MTQPVDARGSVDPEAGTVALAADGVRFGYVPGRPVLDGVSHPFVRGAITALTGPSGRGKSTLLYVLAGLLRPQGGRVLVGEESLYAGTEAWRCRLRASRFSFIFQDAVLDAQRSVLDAVREPCLYSGTGWDGSRERALALMARLGVEVDPDSRPGQISGGQAQRIGVCRALMLQPEVIFADEPTGNLDKTSARAVLDALAEAAASGATVLVATHDDRVLLRCDDRLDLT